MMSKWYWKPYSLVFPTSGHHCALLPAGHRFVTMTMMLVPAGSPVPQVLHGEDPVDVRL